MPARRRSNMPPPTRRKLPPRAAPKIRPFRPRKPPLHVAEILEWADKHRERTGYWPIAKSGEVVDAPWQTWYQIDDALRSGYRGCRPGGSLAKLLRIHRGKHPRKGYPRKSTLTVEEILAWAEKFHDLSGMWPVATTPGAAGPRPRELSWMKIDKALRRGTRGMPGGSSLAQLMLEHHGVRRSSLRARLTVKQILAWAGEHHQRTGRWPSVRSGKVENVPDENWPAIHASLEKAGRGLPPGYTLATLLKKYRRHRYRRDLVNFSEAEILKWADAYRRRNGRWPTLKSGPIPQAPGETWLKVYGALSKGYRGMPGGESLSEFLIRHKRRIRRNRGHHPARHGRLTVKQILLWADAFQRREGCWPRHGSGKIKGTRDETWMSVDRALRQGLRGLEGDSSVALVLMEHRGAPHPHHKTRLVNRDILAWADAHHRETGQWPKYNSGPIPESVGDTWAAVDNALRKGARGRRGGDSLARLLKRYGRSRSRSSR